MKLSFLMLPGLGLLLGLAGCNTPAAKAPEAAHPSRPSPRAVAALPATPPAMPPAPATSPVQAVRYEFLKESASKPDCQDANGDSHSLKVVREFMHLLGPDTLRPALQKLQCPLPAQRRAQLQQELSGLRCGGEDEDSQYSSYSNTVVNYNANGLLSLLVLESTYSGGAYPQNNSQLCTYDLATGKRCEVQKWLRPGKDLALRQLLTKYLRADSTGKEYVANSIAGEEAAPGKPYVVEQLPSLGLNDKGLFFLLGDLGAPHVIEGVDITVPYAALRAYVRPGTPLARVVAAHGR